VRRFQAGRIFTTTGLTFILITRARQSGSARSSSERAGHDQRPLDPRRLPGHRPSLDAIPGDLRRNQNPR
jgi:hypothetical protein